MQAHFEALSYSQGTARCCHLNIKLVPRFRCREYLCKIMRRYWQFLQSYRFHKAAWPWASLKVQKGHTNKDQHRRHPWVWCGEYYYQVTTRYRQFMKSYRVQCPPRCCVLESLKKRSLKGQDQNWLKFWWVEHHSLYSYNMMQPKSDALSYSQGAAIWTWPSSKGQVRNRPRFWCGEYLKITKRYWQFLQLSCSQGSLTVSYLKVQKGHTKVNVELVRDFYVENTHVKLQHDTSNLRKVIAFTRSSQMQILMLYHIHKKLQDAAIWTWPISKGQHRTHPRFWCGEYLCKITKWYRQLLQLSCSQGSLTVS